MTKKPIIGAWPALIWAYAKENVRAHNAHLAFRDDGRARYTERGAIGGFLEAHIDAINIDAKLNASLDYSQYARIARAAEARKIIPDHVVLPERKAVPVMTNTGRGLGPKVLRHPVSHRPFLCEIHYVGYSKEEIDDAQNAQRAMFNVFVAVLDTIDGMELERWSVRGRGLDNLRERLDKVSHA